MDNTTVTPVPIVYSQSRQTKLGLAVVAIKQEGDLWDARVTISYNDVTFSASAILSDACEAYHWTYGVKQAVNDDYAGYQVKDGMLVESHPPKTRVARVLTVSQALSQVQSNYDHFELGKSSSSSDNISIKSLTTSTLLSDDDKAVMAGILAKLGKVAQ